MQKILHTAAHWSTTGFILNDTDKIWYTMTSQDWYWIILIRYDIPWLVSCLLHYWQSFSNCYYWRKTMKHVLTASPTRDYVILIPLVQKRDGLFYFCSEHSQPGRAIGGKSGILSQWNWGVAGRKFLGKNKICCFKWLINRLFEVLWAISRENGLCQEER